MSLGGEKDKGIIWLIYCFVVGLILLGTGILAILDSSGFPIMRIFDWGKYQVLIEILLIAIGAYNIIPAVSGYDCTPPVQRARYFGEVFD